jgi:hypothetical protein
MPNRQADERQWRDGSEFLPPCANRRRAPFRTISIVPIARPSRLMFAALFLGGRIPGLSSPCRVSLTSVDLVEPHRGPFLSQVCQAIVGEIGGRTRCSNQFDRDIYSHDECGVERTARTAACILRLRQESLHYESTQAVTASILHNSGFLAVAQIPTRGLAADDPGCHAESDRRRIWKTGRGSNTTLVERIFGGIDRSWSYLRSQTDHGPSGKQHHCLVELSAKRLRGQNGSARLGSHDLNKNTSTLGAPQSEIEF